EGRSGPCSLADLNDLPAAGQSVREGDGQGLGSCRVGGGHRLQMQVRFGAVARVATATDQLPGSDLLVDANRGAGVLEVAQGHEDIVATVGAGGGVRLDHDVVPGHVGPAASYASRLGERV